MNESIGTAIEAENLMYAYGDITAVDGISFELHEGEILGFLGPNGAGKTTTINMLTGQLKPQKGRATLLGMDITKEALEIKKNIGVCFEHNNLYEKMSALENLKLFAKLFGLKSFDGMALLRRVGLAGREKDKVETYSKGMKQRLMVARAIVSEPKILFLDEPTSGLDPNSAADIRSIILEEKKRGAAVFLTTHDMNEADKLSDRVAFINNGTIVSLDTPHNLKQQYGQRSFHVTYEKNGVLMERHIEMNRESSPEEIKKLLSEENVVTLHSEEASLESIFIRLTGRGLTG